MAFLPLYLLGKLAKLPSEKAVKAEAKRLTLCATVYSYSPRSGEGRRVVTHLLKEGRLRRVASLLFFKGKLLFKVFKKVRRAALGRLGGGES